MIADDSMKNFVLILDGLLLRISDESDETKLFYSESNDELDLQSIGTSLEKHGQLIQAHQIQ